MEELYCVVCLRMIRDGQVTFAPGDQTPHMMRMEKLAEVLHTYGTRALVPIEWAIERSERIGLYVRTMINNQYRCIYHLDD